MCPFRMNPWRLFLSEHKAGLTATILTKRFAAGHRHSRPPNTGAIQTWPDCNQMHLSNGGGGGGTEKVKMLQEKSSTLSSHLTLLLLLLCFASKPLCELLLRSSI